ncbi:MAG TPA: hypothetical protein VHO25_08085, partial [Polyangiaceae bacterium]|nr:hypothetical protein [Polyangiaceae bacterium]
MDIDGNGSTQFVALARGGVDNSSAPSAHPGEILLVPPTGTPGTFSFHDGLLENIGQHTFLPVPASVVPVGFGVGHVNLDGTPDYVLAHTTTGSDLIVEFFTAGTGAVSAAPVTLFSNMGLVEPLDENSNFLGFTTNDDDADGITDLVV